MDNDSTKSFWCLEKAQSTKPGGKMGMRKEREERIQVRRTPDRRCTSTTAGVSRVLSRLNYPITALRYQSTFPDLEVRGGERSDPQKSMCFVHRPLGVDRSMDHRGSKKQSATEVGRPCQRNENGWLTHVVRMVRQSCPGRTEGRRYRLPLIALRYLASPILLPPSHIPERPERKYEERQNTSHHT